VAASEKLSALRAIDWKLSEIPGTRFGAVFLSRRRSRVRAPSSPPNFFLFSNLTSGTAVVCWATRCRFYRRS